MRLVAGYHSTHMKTGRVFFWIRPADQKGKAKAVEEITAEEKLYLRRIFFTRIKPLAEKVLKGASIEAQFPDTFMYPGIPEFWVTKEDSKKPILRQLLGWMNFCDMEHSA